MASQRKDRTEPNVVDLAPDEPPKADVKVDEEAPDAVLVVKSTDEDGTISVDVVALGKVMPTEVQTLLELGVGKWRQQIGLASR
jgi:hypothetical protein